MRYRLIARSWASEFWINLRYSPLRLVPCLVHKPYYWEAAAEHVCDRCGSVSARVQRKGERQAEGLRGKST